MPPLTAGRANSWRSLPSKVISTCSIASPVSQFGRYRNGRFRRATFRERRRRLHNPSRPSHPHTRVRSSDDVVDFTPTLRAQALTNLKRYLWEPTPFIAPQLPNGQVLGAINVGNLVGGINWPGASFDPETATFYGQANNSAVTVSTISAAYQQVVSPETQRQSGRGPVWEGEPAGRGRGA